MFTALVIILFFILKQHYSNELWTVTSLRRTQLFVYSKPIFSLRPTHRQSECTTSYKNPHPHISTIGFFLGLTLQRKFFPSWKFPFSESNDPLGFRFRSHALPNRVTYSFTSRSRSVKRRRTMNATFALFKKNLRVVLSLFVRVVVVCSLWC